MNDTIHSNKWQQRCFILFIHSICIMLVWIWDTVRALKMNKVIVRWGSYTNAIYGCMYCMRLKCHNKRFIKLTWIDLYGQVNDVMAIFTDPYISLIWTVAPSSQQQHRNHIHKSFMGFFISWRGQSLSRGKTITQAVNMLQRLFQSTPMLQQTEQHTQIFHKIKVKVKRNPSICACLRIAVD